MVGYKQQNKLVESYIMVVVWMKWQKWQEPASAQALADVT